MYISSARCILSVNKHTTYVVIHLGYCIYVHCNADTGVCQNTVYERQMLEIMESLEYLATIHWSNK